MFCGLTAKKTIWLKLRFTNATFFLVMTVSGKCGPPPDVNNADTIELKKDEYNTGERVEYSCFNKFTLDLRPSFSKYLTCVKGEWRGNIRCLSKYEHASPYISYKHIMM
uniref:Sushi domain-containing protein n=1 Tax=Sinocyclocheilus grahami TaxID=75366 RepID=A0A672PRM1_SINGR